IQAADTHALDPAVEVDAVDRVDPTERLVDTQPPRRALWRPLNPNALAAACRPDRAHKQTLHMVADVERGKEGVVTQQLVDPDFVQTLQIDVDVAVQHLDAAKHDAAED